LPIADLSRGSQNVPEVNGRERTCAALGKTGKPGDRCRGKGPGGEQSEIECRESVHGTPHAGPPGACAAGMGQRLADRSGWGVVAWTCV